MELKVYEINFPLFYQISFLNETSPVFCIYTLEEVQLSDGVMMFPLNTEQYFSALKSLYMQVSPLK